MKNLISTLLLASCTSSLMAQETAELPSILVMGNSSPLTQLCFAAAESDAELEAMRIRHNISETELDDVRCNDRTLPQFARYYRALQTRISTNVSLKGTDDSPETQLCMAALKSESAYEEAKSGFPLHQKIEDSLRCNDMTLEQFMNRFQYRRITAAL